MGPHAGAHSLRAGVLTSAARCGASVFKMRDVSRHKSMDVGMSGLMCILDGFGLGLEWPGKSFPSWEFSLPK
jgi:hypothetical protein